MARKAAKSDGIRPEQPNWFLKEWMKSKRMKQAALAKECGWSNSTMHGIYHGRTDYYREIVNLIASKLHIEPWELLMHPDKAAAIKQYEASVKQMVKLATVNELDHAKQSSTGDRKRTGTDDN